MSRIPRRRFLAGATTAAALQRVNIAQPRPRNVLLLIADDLGCFLPSHGDPNAVMPVLERTAAEGVRFSNAYCTTGELQRESVGDSERSLQPRQRAVRPRADGTPFQLSAACGSVSEAAQGLWLRSGLHRQAARRTGGALRLGYGRSDWIAGRLSHGAIRAQVHSGRWIQTMVSALWLPRSAPRWRRLRQSGVAQCEAAAARPRADRWARRSA